MVGRHIIRINEFQVSQMTRVGSPDQGIAKTQSAEAPRGVGGLSAGPSLLHLYSGFRPRISEAGGTMLPAGSNSVGVSLWQGSLAVMWPLPGDRHASHGASWPEHFQQLWSGNGELLSHSPRPGQCPPRPWLP